MSSASPIFVAGGTGMVGSALIRKLLSSGYTNIVSNYHHRVPAPKDERSVRLVRLDLTRQGDTEAFFCAERPAYVLLAAAKVGGILANSTYKADFIYDNLAIATNVIKCAHEYGVTKLLNLGSSCIYPRLAPQPMKEDYLLTGPLEPTNEPYAIAKIAAIKLCRYFNEQYGTNFVSVMPTNLYGPNDNFNLETAHVLPALIRKFQLANLLSRDDYARIAFDIKAFPLGFGMDNNVDTADRRSTTKILKRLGIDKESVTLWGTGDPRREFLYVDDLAESAVFLLEHGDPKDIGEFVNVGSGRDLTIGEMAEIVREVVGFEGTIKHDRSKPDGMPQKLLDISRIDRLGWKPLVSIREGIRKTCEWYAGAYG
jgi:GDP-L-fucose synthase